MVLKASLKVTVDSMQCINQAYIPNQTHWQAAHVSLTEDFQRNIV